MIRACWIFWINAASSARDYKNTLIFHWTAGISVNIDEYYVSSQNQDCNSILFILTCILETAIPSIKLNITIEQMTIAKKPIKCDVTGKYWALEKVDMSALDKFAMVKLFPLKSTKVIRPLGDISSLTGKNKLSYSISPVIIVITYLFSNVVF